MRVLLLHNYDKMSRIFSCILLIPNYMIFLVQFEINKHLQIFSKTTNCTRPKKKFTNGIREFVIVLINNGNRTEWSPIRSVMMRVIDKIGQPRSGSAICQSRVWLQTGLDDMKSCYQLIVTITISEKPHCIISLYWVMF